MNKTNIQYKNKIEEIARIEGAVSKYKDNTGLYSCTGGQLLLLAYLGKCTGEKKYGEQKIALIKKIFDNIGDVQQFSLARGFSGIGWLFEHLEEQKLFEADTNVLLEDFDEVLSNHLEYEFRINHWDFLHGALGIVFYFQKRLKKNNSLLPVLQRSLSHLEALSEKQTDGTIKWRSVLKLETGEQGYNISMSHGITSIIVMLANLYNTGGLDQKKIKELLEGAVGYLLQQEIDKDKYGSYFPNFALESQEDLFGSRLSWCYGDLGIAVGLRKAGIILGNKEWENKALEILLYTAKNRRSLQQGLVFDAGLCHGTAGIAHIFYRMWWDTHIPEFKDAAGYWFDETLKMAQFNDAPAGFKAWDGKEKDWEINYDFLGGTMGIGVALLSYYYQIDPAWDECLLLS